MVSRTERDDEENDGSEKNDGGEENDGSIWEDSEEVDYWGELMHAKISGRTSYRIPRTFRQFSD